MTCMLKTRVHDFDPLFATGLTNFLFRLRGMKFGQDLVARNIQASDGFEKSSEGLHTIAVNPVIFKGGKEHGTLTVTEILWT